MIEMVTRSAQETWALGKSIGKQLRGGEVLALTGPLGSGKTVFVKGLAAGLGATGPVRSPTFTILQTYSQTGPTKHQTFFHFDLYRIKSPTELRELGIEEVLSGKRNIVAIEWPETAQQYLPSNTLRLAFSPGSKPNERKIRIA